MNRNKTNNNENNVNTDATEVKKIVSKAKNTINSANVKSGRINKKKTREAAMIGGAGFGWNTFGGAGINISARNNSYANMGQGSGMFGDVPLYFALLNEQNGGILYWPTTLKEKYSWFRYFANTDPYVKSAIRLHTDLPMSKLVLRMPKMKDKELRKKILIRYENMVKKLNLFDKLHSILFELNVIGNCSAFTEFNEEKKEWEKIVILPPEEVTISKFPMSNESKIQYCPEVLNSVLKRYSIPVSSYEDYVRFIKNLDDDEREVLENIPYDFAKQLIENNGNLIMDTSPYCGDGDHKIGSFVYHFADKRHEYNDLGVSPLECVLVPLLMKMHYKYTQLSLASRNMTPRNKISAAGISESALEELREQVDMSMLNPDYTIVTNYEWNWEQIGAENRLIDLGREYEVIHDELFAGLGVTKELLTGEGMYSGSKISVEILNTRYLLTREMLQRYVEDSLFLPMAKENDFYEVDEFGNKIYLYPRLSFSRLTIRDNAEVFDSLFQLYQKGSVPIGVILDLFNLDSDEINEQLVNDMFTPKDAVFNDMLRGVYGELSSKIVEETDLADQIIDSMIGPTGKKLNKQEIQSDEENFNNESLEDSKESIEDILPQNEEQENKTESKTNNEKSLTIDDLINEIEAGGDSENEQGII